MCVCVLTCSDLSAMLCMSLLMVIITFLGKNGVVPLGELLQKAVRILVASRAF